MLYTGKELEGGGVGTASIISLLPFLSLFLLLSTCNYFLHSADESELQNIQWRVVIIDEAHRLKNRNCKLLEGLKTLDLEHRVLLTGTPLQNSVEELFSLLNFLEPSTFPSHLAFLQQFGDLKSEEQVEELKTVRLLAKSTLVNLLH